MSLTNVYSTHKNVTYSKKKLGVRSLSVNQDDLIPQGKCQKFCNENVTSHYLFEPNKSNYWLYSATIELNQSFLVLYPKYLVKYNPVQLFWGLKIKP